MGVLGGGGLCLCGASFVVSSVVVLFLHPFRAYMAQ